MREDQSSEVCPPIGTPDRKSIYRRLKQLVDEAIRQQRIEQSVWSIFLEVCALLLVVIGLGLIARFIYIEHELRNKPVPNALTAIIAVHGPDSSPVITRFEKELAARIETGSDPEILGEAKSFGLSGTVRMFVAMTRDDRLGEVILSRPSGDETLNRAACRALTKHLTFNAMPEEMRKHEKTVMTVLIAIDHGAVKKPARIGSRGKVRRSCAELLKSP